MNLVIDIGNTSTKLALYEGHEKISVSRINDLSCSEIDKILTSNKIKRAIISSVKDLPAFIHDLLFHSIDFVHELSYKSILPFIIDYETPETLGPDRIAAAAGAYKLSPGAEIMVIDAGSAITIDFLSGNKYKGGNISPGLNMRFRSLNQFTGKLPLQSVSENYSSPGRNTADAIKAGVISGVVYEINEYIRTFEKKHVDNKIVLTGGDAGFLKDKISTGIIYQPDLVTDGLNYILEYNAK